VLSSSYIRIQTKGKKRENIMIMYLGVPVYKVKPKAIHLQGVSDEIKSKLSSWKASLFSIVGRNQLVK